MIRFATIIGAGFSLAACVPAAPPAWLVQPADPALGIRAPRYATVTSGVQRFDVVEPSDWRELNRQVAPGGAPSPGESSTGRARRAR